jgi:hypothetical protein
MFNGGQIECLSWDNFGMYSEWKTREISGYISDYAYGDINNDGEKELVFSVVKSSESVMSDAKSYIASQKILPVKK